MLETGDEEAGGFVLTRATVAELGEIDLLKLSARPAANALLLARQDLSRPAEQLARHLEHLQVKVEVQRLRGFPKMMDEPHRSEVPDQFCESSVGWVTRGRKVTPEPVKSATIPRETSIVLPGMGRRSQIRERPVKFNRLFGVLGAPVDAPGERARTAILFLNAGGVPHMGPNRMYVALAREWASLGFTTLRFDVGGLGDSVWLGTVAGRMYSREVVGDARAALSFVRDTCGIDRTVLVGLCSGAYVAFYTALEMPGAITAQVLLNPQTFNFRPGESLDVRVLGPRSFARQSNWLQLTRGQIGFRDIRGALRRGVERIGARASFLPRQPALTRNGLNLARAFHSIASVGTQTLLVYSRDDPGLEYFRARVGRDLRKLTATGRFRIELVDGADHTFTPAWSQRHIARLLTDFALSV
jgi:pimeloyl-ACP methyl ester carboxylesterase